MCVTLKRLGCVPAGVKFLWGVCVCGGGLVPDGERWAHLTTGGSGRRPTAERGTDGWTPGRLAVSDPPVTLVPSQGLALHPAASDSDL